MTYELKLTKELNEQMHPTDKVYGSNSLPSYYTKDSIEWSNNDKQYIITLDRNTNIFTGHHYDWNEETQDWDDANDVPMTADEILHIIKEDSLLMVTRR